MAKREKDSEVSTLGTPAKRVNPLRMDPKALVAAEKRSMAFELRLAGWMPDEIAVHLGMSEAQVEQALSLYCQQVKEKDARHTLELREIELARIDSMLAGVYPAAVTGTTEAINAAVKLMELRAKITGSMENQPLIQQHFVVELLGDPENVKPDIAKEITVDTSSYETGDSSSTEARPVVSNQSPQTIRNIPSSPSKR